MVPSAGLHSLAEPELIGFGAALGAVFARTVASRLGYDEDKCIRWGADGSYYGAGIALVVYLIVNLLEAGFS
ncbi:MAG TPA: hypothetical protein VH703_05620 [Solirubrobacterales bacterium]|jgi:hypothetical protein